jgi:hypothetical protein
MGTRAGPDDAREIRSIWHKCEQSELSLYNAADITDGRKKPTAKSAEVTQNLHNCRNPSPE